MTIYFTQHIQKKTKKNLVWTIRMVGLFQSLSSSITQQDIFNTSINKILFYAKGPNLKCHLYGFTVRFYFSLNVQFQIKGYKFSIF